MIIVIVLLNSCDKVKNFHLTTTAEVRGVPTNQMFFQRAFPKGTIKETALQEAKSWKKNFYNNNALLRNGNDSGGTLVGPTNAGGRVADVEIPFDQQNTYYVAAASGGIFKTEDGGNTWKSIFEDQGVLAMGDIEISKKNADLVWVGTGEADAPRAYPGNGVFKSENGGIDWESKGLTSVGTVGKVKLDPNDDNTIFVAAMGPVYRKSEDKGIFRSRDGGESWTKVLYINDTTGGIDLAIHPSNSNIIYASMWQREFTQNRSIYGGPSSGLYRSLDGGDTWEKLTNGLSTSNDISKIKVEIAPSNPNIVYAMYINAAGNIVGFYFSNDGGDNWEERNSSQLPSVGFNEYFGDIYIDPTDENVIYNMGLQVFKTTNGGQSWEHIFVGVHFDQQAFSFNPSLPGQIIIGNDGGVYKSDDSGASITKINNLPITQFYRLHVNQNNNNTIYGGSQDNGSWRSETPDGIDNWEKVNEGDGMQPLAATSDGSFWYTSTQSGQFYKQGQGFSIVTPTIGADERNNWDTPITFDPSDTESIFYGTNKLYRSKDGAETWDRISPDLSNGPGPSTRPFGTTTTIDVSTVDNEIIYAGLDDGNVWITENGGADWTKISDNLPVRWVTKVYADRDNSNKVYVTLSGYAYGEDNGNIYVSEDRGQSWTAIGSSLPDIPINDVVKDSEGKLIIATDAGLFLTDNEGNTWQPIGANLPTVPITDLQLVDTDNTLYVATYGRSMYKVDISSIATSSNEIAKTKRDLTIVPNPVKDDTVITLPQSAKQISVVLYDIYGKIVIQNNYSNTHSINLSIPHLTGGTYFILLKTERDYFTEKMIKL